MPHKWMRINKKVEEVQGIFGARETKEVEYQKGQSG